VTRTRLQPAFKGRLCLEYLFSLFIVTGIFLSKVDPDNVIRALIVEFMLILSGVMISYGGARSSSPELFDTFGTLTEPLKGSLSHTLFSGKKDELF